MKKIPPEEFFCEDRIIREKEPFSYSKEYNKYRKTHFVFIRSFLDISLKVGELTDKNYLKIIKILDEEDERMTLESEE